MDNDGEDDEGPDEDPASGQRYLETSVSKNLTSDSWEPPEFILHLEGAKTLIRSPAAPAFITGQDAA